MQQQAIEIQAFYSALLYYPMTFLPEKEKTEYKYKILSLVEEQMQRRRYKDYSKYFLYLSLRKLGIELSKFMLYAKPTLTEDQKDYMNILQNLNKNIKRVVYDAKARHFPEFYITMTTENLNELVRVYGETHKLQRKPVVLALQDDTYTTLALQVWVDAHKFYYGQ